MNTQSFWYDFWVYENDSFSYYGEYGSTNILDSFTLFSNNEHNADLLTYDPSYMYCAVANLHSSLNYGFSYKWVDCDDYSNTAFRLCFREPILCPTGIPGIVKV